MGTADTLAGNPIWPGDATYVKTPVGPVSLDFGYNLNPPAFPSCQATAVSAFPGASSYCSSDAATPYFVPQRASHFNVFFSIGQSF